MTDEEPIEHGEVVSSLLDLQRRLRATERGHGGEAGTPPVPDAPASLPTSPEPPAGSVEVSEADVTVVMTPAGADDPSRGAGSDAAERFAPVTQLPTASGGEDRVAALTERLARLEQDLSGVLGSIDTLRSDVADDAELRVELTARAADLRTASMVADRMDALATRLMGELGMQRRNLTDLLGERMDAMEASLREAIRDAARDLDRDGSPG